MADKKISQLTAAAALTGSEPIPTVQGGVTVQTTAQDIADLAAGGSSFLPNGIEFVSESRDFQASDAGKRLFISGENTVISMPEVNPFAVGDYVGIIKEGTADVSFNTEYEGEYIFPLNTGDGSFSECVVLMNTELEDSSWLFPISTSFIYDNTDSKNKTALRYLMDNVGETGTATLVAGTVTVADERVRTGAKIFVSVDTPGGTQGFMSAPVASIIDATSFVINSSSATETSTVNYWFVNP